MAKKNVKSLRQMIREYPEQAGSLDNLLNHMRTVTGKDIKDFPPFAKVPEVGSMRVEVPDTRLTDGWRVAAHQLVTAGGVAPILASEGGRTAHGRDLVGDFDASMKLYEYWLKSPGGKPDGDFLDGTGALEVSVLQHDIGFTWEGMHAMTGRVLYGLAERYFLSGDETSFKKLVPRLQAAADWIIRQRDGYLKDLPNRSALHIAGLQPPLNFSDGTPGHCEWRWYLHHNAVELQGLHRFAQAMATIDPSAGQRYLAEAERYRQDIRRAVQEETVRAPVRQVRDGTYRSFIPPTAMTRGVMMKEYGSPNYGLSDNLGAVTLGEPYSALSTDYTPLNSTLDILTEWRIPEASYAKGDAWFWEPNGKGRGAATLPKCSANANQYLLQDDIPNFLHFWGNYYAALVIPSGQLREWPNFVPFGPIRGMADSCSCSWFLEGFRNL
ncbi:MAG: hypothetical protein WCI20_15255, partial [bacterium]